jgi:hypothetical protein
MAYKTHVLSILHAQTLEKELSSKVAEYPWPRIIPHKVAEQIHSRLGILTLQKWELLVSNTLSRKLKCDLCEDELKRDPHDYTAGFLLLGGCSVAIKLPQYLHQQCWLYGVPRDSSALVYLLSNIRSLVEMKHAKVAFQSKEEDIILPGTFLNAVVCCRCERMIALHYISGSLYYAIKLALASPEADTDSSDLKHWNGKEKFLKDRLRSNVATSNWTWEIFHKLPVHEQKQKQKQKNKNQKKEIETKAETRDPLLELVIREKPTFILTQMQNVMNTLWKFSASEIDDTPKCWRTSKVY